MLSNAFGCLGVSALRSERFRLLDIGCAGGIEPLWRVFGDRLEAIAIDASVDECARLTAMERNPHVVYVAGFASDSQEALDLTKDPAWAAVKKRLSRLSAFRMMLSREARLQADSTEKKIRQNAWYLTSLADATRSIVVPELLEERMWSDLDLLKIDIDGADFLVLRTFKDRLRDLGVLAVQLEVNFVGGVGPDEHVFHNTDRFMRAQGFQLVRLEVRNYSSSCLPAAFLITSPAQTVTGCPIQGDAFYSRDVITDHAGLSAEKLLKLATIASLWNVPDFAAEILVTHESQLKALLDIESGLDALAFQTQAGRTEILSYREYMNAFEREAPMFFPEPFPAEPTFLQRLRAAAAAFYDVEYADKIEKTRVRAKWPKTRKSN